MDTQAPQPTAFEQARDEFLAGLACQKAHNHVQAESHYRASLQYLPGRPSTLVNLAATQLQLGKPAEALASADAALASEPDSPDALLHRGSALARLGRAGEALASFEQLNRLVPDLALAWTHRGSLLRELGRLADARTAFEQALHCGADPELHRYYLAALGAQTPPAAPPRAYVESLFDAYAGDFDAHLLETLGYCAHVGLIDRVRACADGRVFDSALDLGCGTGLCGPLLRPLARQLTGIDLSAAMLERSRERGGYDALVQADAVAFLAGTPQRHDLIVAADVLIYVGDPQPLFAAASRAMTEGLFAFTAETSDAAATTDGWRLQTSLRYAHEKAHLLRLTQQHGFEALQVEEAPVRHEQGQTVQGLYMVLRRQPNKPTAAV